MNFDVAHENDANPESILEIQFLGDVNNTGFNPGPQHQVLHSTLAV